MKKFLITTLLALSIILSSYTIFAANTMVGNTLKDAAEGTRNVVGNMENGIENGAKNVKNAVTGATGNMENAAQGATNGVMNTMDGNYTAERTAGSVTVWGMSANTWTWLILAIVGIAIIGLVWYYGAQYEHKDMGNE